MKLICAAAFAAGVVGVPVLHAQETVEVAAPITEATDVAISESRAEDQQGARDVAPEAAPVYLADSASPFGPTDVTNADAANVEMPDMVFTATPSDREDYDKYYVFHRDDTDFATAYADIRECDGYASGLRSSIGYQPAYYPYTGTIAGSVGSALGSVLADAIYGSGERRALRRTNMRNCMFYKGYGRYGLPKDVWQTFNFEEGNRHVKAGPRDIMLRQQALVASSWEPQGAELGQ